MSREKRRNQQWQPRVSQNLGKRAVTWLFVSEGTETEVNYFRGLGEEVERLSGGKIRFRAEGTGRNTLGVVEAVNDYLGVVDDLKRARAVRYGKIFTVFDKDSFKSADFNVAIELSKARGHIPLWSNESFELWFLLHYTEQEEPIGRNECMQKLGFYFRREHGKAYKKNFRHIYAMISGGGKLRDAVRRAEKLWRGCGECAPHACNPCTAAFLVFGELGLEGVEFL